MITPLQGFDFIFTPFVGRCPTLNDTRLSAFQKRVHYFVKCSSPRIKPQRGFIIQPGRRCAIALARIRATLGSRKKGVTTPTGLHITEACWRQNNDNPGGVSQQSEGWRVSAPPWKSAIKNINPGGVAYSPVCTVSNGQPFQG